VSDISQAKEPIIDESSVFLTNNKKYAATPKNRIVLSLVSSLITTRDCGYNNKC
jgi:hypothetical protein